MSLIDKICELWDRTLSPIETQKILNIKDKYNEEVILEAAMISSDKVHPMQYMCKILYYMDHPTESPQKKEVIEEKEIIHKSKWLENFHKSEWGKQFKEETKKN